MLLQTAVSSVRRGLPRHSWASSCRIADTVLSGQQQQRFASEPCTSLGRMFAGNPELQNVFNQTNQTLGGQPKKLLKTVALAAQAAIATGELPGEAIEGICQKHCALHVGPDAFGVVGANILGTIEDLLTKDQAVLDAWGALYGDIANVFITREAEINKEVAAVPGSWSGRRKFVMAKKEKVSSSVTRFKFEPVDGQPTPDFEPGKFTTIWVPVEEEGPYGHYSEQPRHYTLAVPRKKEDANTGMSISVKKDGLISRILHAAETGTEWELSAPHGCFVMSGVEKLWLSSQDAPVVFISAGVGITPVLAMLENIYVTRPATWLHASQDGAVHPYRERLREIAAVRGGELQRRVWYSNPLPEDGHPGGNETSPHMFNVAKYHYEGRMDLAMSELEEITHLGNEEAHYYMCGPEGFMDAQRDTLVKLGVAEDRIHWEGF
ncbi:Is involved in NO detoxification in an aerobic process [Seminavis robusta]|uniref:nitric oxide dioxygenase n=1 Tax=Seminavis robusta TaxID=568900 RepID=A0A9N8HG06_9STRA|nr:Is involved in NO detoxification in an aerobic process [Seminavis robusta]|eukprot:Sro375_g129420.1 Is involved in NO detoxification in an aerobic process (436) ;mRNA; r:29924-31450